MPYRQSVALCLVAAAGFLIVVPSLATAQADDRDALLLVREVHVKPDMVDQYENARRDAIRARTDGAFAFSETASMSGEPVYRYGTPLDGWSDVERRQDFFQGPRPEFAERLRDATAHIDLRLDRRRYDFSYILDNPRLRPSEAGYVREIRLYIRPGMQAQVAALQSQIAELRRRHDIRNTILASSSIVASDWPVFTLLFFAHDAEDLAAQQRREFEVMGDAYLNLIGQVRALCRRVEQTDYTTRRDLAYSPTN